MGTVLLAYPDYLGGAGVTPSGGAWEDMLPLANLLSPRFVDRARSLNTTLAATQFWLDLGQQREVRAASCPRSNGSLSCRVRLRGFAAQDTATTPVVDTGWRDLFVEVFAIEALYWGHPSLWDGRYTADDLAVGASTLWDNRFGRDTSSGFAMPYLAIFATGPVARYWLWEFADTDNAAGYLEISRIVMAPGWQPSINMVYGATLSVEDGAAIQTTATGADYAGRASRRRVARFSLQALPQDEAMTWAFGAQTRLGTTGTVLFSFDPDDAKNLHRWSFVGRMRALSPVEASSYGLMTAAFEILEQVT